MSVAVAIAALGGAFAACLVLVRSVRVRPLGLAAPLALALLVCTEAAMLQALSRLGAVAATPVACANLALAGIGALVAWRVPRARLRRVRVGPPWVVAPLAVLFALAALSALAYPPNNWDSMTYHLARVAHWIQRRSVEPYPTGVPRQNALLPGAEYLVLVLQVVSGTDRLAALVQLGAWGVLVGAATPLARAFGARRSVARLGAVVVGSAPMAVLQASSTQNDLVAAALTAALAAAALPLLHRRRRWRGGDLLLLLAAGAGAVLVKPTAVLFASPLLALAAVGWGRTVLAGGLRALGATAPAAVLALLVAVPLAGAAREARAVTGEFEYQGASGPLLAERARNAVRGVLRNLPVPERLAAVLAPARTEGCERPGELCLSIAWYAHEDSAGSPALAALALAAAACAALRRGPRAARARLGAAALVSGWVLFHAELRDNVWIARLQLPAAALVPLALGALPRAGGPRLRAIALAGVASLAFAQGVWTAVMDLRRPLVPWRTLRTASAASSYYRGGPAGVGEAHAAVLEALGRDGCGRLGLRIGGNSYDYPLTWRAMQRGVEVRHVLGPDDWPCAIFTDTGAPPPRPDGAAWVPTGVPGFLEVGPR